MMIYMSDKLEGVETIRTDEGMIGSCVYAQPWPWEPVKIKYPEEGGCAWTTCKSSGPEVSWFLI
jgi:hypothetical protein